MLAPVRPRTPATGPREATEHDAAVRARLSAHLAGLALVPTVAALAEHGVLGIIRQASDVSVESLASRTQMAPARLRIALRLLAACGWLEEHRAADSRQCHYTVTTAGRAACDLAPSLFREATAGLGAIVDLPQAFGAECDDGLTVAVGALAGLSLSADLLRDTDPESARLVVEPLGGLTVVAAIVTLAHAGILDLLVQGPLRLLETDALLQTLFDRLAAEGWLTRAGADLRLTPAGTRAALMAPACAEVWSYLPVLLQAGAADEVLNVAGRGAAFRLWAAPLDELIVDLFSRPVSQQPRGICDVACGSGALLEHVYRLIRDRTSRGRVLKEHPLLVLGADGSLVAREATARVLRTASVPRFHISSATASYPAAIADDAARHQIGLRDLLHLRILVGAADADDEPAGDADPTSALARSFARWLPYAGRFGIAVLERHPADLDADREPDRVAAAAYDALSGHASRALCNADSLVEAARRVGLDRHPRFRAQFPESAVPAVSFSYFTTAGRTPV